MTLAAFLPCIAAVPEGWMRWPTETREVRDTIEELSAGRCHLYLTSRHRLTTRFNGYAGRWSGHIMSAIQRTILGVIRARAERVAGHQWLRIIKIGNF